VATPSCDFGAVTGSRSWTIGHGGGQGRVRVLVVPIQERGVRRSPSRSRDGKKEGAGAQHGALEKRGKRGWPGPVAPRGGEGRGGASGAGKGMAATEAVASRVVREQGTGRARGRGCQVGCSHSTRWRGMADRGGGSRPEFKLIQNLIQTN
jgi:hypothetical protein